MKRQNILIKVCIVFLIVISNSVPTEAQVKFKKLYPGGAKSDYSRMWFNLVDSTIYLALEQSVLKMDLQGNVIQRLDMKEVSQYPEISENRIILLKHDGPGPYVTKLKTMITDFSLTQKQVFGYQLPHPTGWERVSVCHDKSYLIQTILNPPVGNPFVFMMLLDSSNQVLYQKSYTGAYFTKTIPFKNKELITAGRTPAGNLAVANLDSLGNVLWAREYSISASWFPDLQLVNDGDTAISIINSLTSNPNGTFGGKVFMANINGSGKTNWFHLIGDTNYRCSTQWTTHRIKKMPDGGYLLLMSVGSDKFNPPLGGFYMSITKTDPAGNVQWTRFHGEQLVGVFVNDIVLLPDKGFFTSASVSNDHFGGGYYIVRTDSMGFAGCQEYTDTLPVIYNFPVTDSLIQITTAPVVITTYTATVPDTIYPLPQPSNGCLLTGLQSTSEGPRSTLSLYPNPATGKVTVQLPAGQLPEELVVTDAMGRTVRTMRPAPGTQIEIDLTGLPPGLLLVRVITQQGVLSARLVKQ
jgi:hypothetical protein